jgi:integrase
LQFLSLQTVPIQSVSILGFSPYTTLLHANGEDVKLVQELLRHASAKITLDTYAQAVTPAKRKAQRKIVEMLRRGDERAV